MLELIQNFDQWLFDAVQVLAGNPFAETVMGELTLLGSVILWVAVSICLWASGRKRESLLLIAVVAASSLIILPLKFFVLRERPLELVQGAASWINSSFPSGHTARAFAAATVVDRFLPKGRVFFWALAVLVGLSRVFLGVHWPTDVIFGAVIGWLSALLVLWSEIGRRRQS